MRADAAAHHAGCVRMNLAGITSLQFGHFQVSGFGAAATIDASSLSGGQ